MVQTDEEFQMVIPTAELLALSVLLDAARVYALRYVQDEAMEDGDEITGCSRQQHLDAVRLMEAIADAAPYEESLLRPSLSAQAVGDDMTAAIAGVLADFDGMDEHDLHSLRWSGGAQPEPLGDAWCMDYLPRAEAIVRIFTPIVAALEAAVHWAGPMRDAPASARPVWFDAAVLALQTKEVK